MPALPNTPVYRFARWFGLYSGVFALSFFIWIVVVRGEPAGDHLDFLACGIIAVAGSLMVNIERTHPPR